jgi:hypothetical protein
MVARTWLGGGSNLASSPSDWTPAGVPQAGDDLTMDGGKMNVVGGVLASAAELEIAGTSDVNLFGATMCPIIVDGAQATINMIGFDNTVDLTTYDNPTLTVNLVGTWIGNFSDGYSNGKLTVTGGVFENTGTSSWGYDGATAVIDSKVTGNGTFDLSSFHGGLAVMEFIKSVGAGQTVDVIPAAGQQQLIIDDPKRFLATVDLGPSGQPGFLPNSVVDLNHLANADSYTYANDLLSIYSHNKVIDTLKLDASALVVAKTAGGVALYNSMSPPTGASLLPVH